MLRDASGSQRPVWTQVLVLAALFLGGGAAGVALSQRLAPQSFLAQFVGLFSFAVPFVAGMNLWLGSAIVVELWRRVAGRRSTLQASRSDVPGGSAAFVPVCGVLVPFAGLLIGILGSSLGVLGTVALYLLLGLSYGTACWLFARLGYLPFPQE